MSTNRSTHNAGRFRRAALAGVLAVAGAASSAAVLAAAPAATAAAADQTGTGIGSESPAARRVPKAEKRFVKRLDITEVAQSSEPLAPPANVPLPKALRDGRADAPALSVRGAAPKTLSPSARFRALAATTSNTGALWPGSRTSNPNAQMGKLYFDINPSPSITDWRHCTGTAVNSENKSLVLTAGHCVWDITNRRWYTNTWFYPGYENGAAPFGAWPVRLQSTTSNYFNTGASADDMAIVLVRRDSAGVALVNRVGGHGIAFNQPVNQFRTAFGYPVTDSRWPGWTSSGEDMYYCQGTDSYYSSGSFAGQMLIGCRMTGGASGGAWLTNVQSNWLGTAQSVNSNKGGIGSAWAGYMFGPYMGAQESAVFQAYRNG